MPIFKHKPIHCLLTSTLVLSALVPSLASTAAYAQDSYSETPVSAEPTDNASLEASTPVAQPVSEFEPQPPTAEEVSYESLSSVSESSSEESSSEESNSNSNESAATHEEITKYLQEQLSELGLIQDDYQARRIENHIIDQMGTAQQIINQLRAYINAQNEIIPTLPADTQAALEQVNIKAANYEAFLELITTPYFPDSDISQERHLTLQFNGIVHYLHAFLSVGIVPTTVYHFEAQLLNGEIAKIINTELKELNLGHLAKKEYNDLTPAKVQPLLDRIQQFMTIWNEYYNSLDATEQGHALSQRDDFVNRLLYADPLTFDRFDQRLPYLSKVLSHEYDSGRLLALSNEEFQRQINLFEKIDYLQNKLQENNLNIDVKNYATGPGASYFNIENKTPEELTQVVENTSKIVQVTQNALNNPNTDKWYIQYLQNMLIREYAADSRQYALLDQLLPRIEKGLATERFFRYENIVESGHEGVHHFVDFSTVASPEVAQYLSELGTISKEDYANNYSTYNTVELVKELNKRLTQAKEIEMNKGYVSTHELMFLLSEKSEIFHNHIGSVQKALEQFDAAYDIAKKFNTAPDYFAANKQLRAEQGKIISDRAMTIAETKTLTPEQLQEMKDIIVEAKSNFYLKERDSLAELLTKRAYYISLLDDIAANAPDREVPVEESSDTSEQSSSSSSSDESSSTSTQMSDEATNASTDESLSATNSSESTSSEATSQESTTSEASASESSSVASSSSNAQASDESTTTSTDESLSATSSEESTHSEATSQESTTSEASASESSNIASASTSSETSLQMEASSEVNLAESSHSTPSEETNSSSHSTEVSNSSESANTSENSEIATNSKLADGTNKPEASLPSMIASEQTSTTSTTSSSSVSTTHSSQDETTSKTASESVSSQTATMTTTQANPAAASKKQPAETKESAPDKQLPKTGEETSLTALAIASIAFMSGISIAFQTKWQKFVKK